MEDEIMQRCASRIESLGYRIIRSEKRQGPFAATLYDVFTSNGQHWIYKEPPPDRTGEVRLVSALGDELAAWLPSGIRCFEDRPAGLLMAYAGEPLWDPGSASSRSEAARRKALSAASEKLAGLHLLTEPLAEDWVRQGKAIPYAYSREWAEWSLSRISDAALPSAPLLVPKALEEMGLIIRKFYDGYRESGMRSPRVFTHGDPHWGNILVQGGRIALIDWEWCHASTPMRDIAILLLDEPDESVYEEIAASHIDRLLQGGYPGNRDGLRHDFDRMVVDNALMSLGWDVELYLRGERTEDDLRFTTNLKRDRIVRFWKRMPR
jgi:thiamine kinase-like enzyme